MNRSYHDQQRTLARQRRLAYEFRPYRENPMFESLFRRMLRRFVEQTVTVATVTRVLDFVIGKLKAVAPDAVDQLLDAMDRPTIAQMVVTFILDALAPVLPPVVFGAALPSGMPASVGTAEVQEAAEKVTAEVVTRLAA